MNIFFTFAFLNFWQLLQVNGYRKRHLAADRAVVTAKPFTVSNFLLDMWNYHNQIRYLHDQKPLELDKRLSENAQDWANCLASDRGEGTSLDKHKNKTVYVEFTKYANDIYGENVFIADFPTENSIPKELAKFAMFNKNTFDKRPVGWFQQKEEYFKDQVQANLNAYTRIIFKTVKYMGCGKAHGFHKTVRKIRLAVVCHYIPPGNNIGERQSVQQFVMPEIPNRNLNDLEPRNLTALETTRMLKPKNPLVLYQLQILELLEAMQYKRPRQFYDPLLLPFQ